MTKKLEIAVKEDARQAKESFRNFLVRFTRCETQEGKDGMTYPCGTCLTALLDRMGLKSDIKCYNEHNEEIDRANEVWRAILQIRDYVI